MNLLSILTATGHLEYILLIVPEETIKSTETDQDIPCSNLSGAPMTSGWGSMP